MSKKEKLKAVVLGMATAGMDTFELDSSSSSSDDSSQRLENFAEVVVLGLDSVLNQVPLPRLGPFIFGSVCRERDNCANMLNIQI